MKDEILQVALKQFRKVGIREMSVQKLSDKLGISTKTVYKYFRNKEHLLEEALLLFYDEEYQILNELSTSENAVHLLLETWYKAIQAEYNLSNLLFQDLRYYYPELQQKIEDIISKRFEEKFVQVIINGVAEGVFQSSLIPKVVMGSIYTLYLRAFRTDDFKRFNVSLFDLYLNTIVVYVKGICTTKGIIELEAYNQQLQATRTVKRSKQV